MPRVVHKEKQGAYSPNVALRSVPGNFPALTSYYLYREAKSLVIVTKTRKVYDVYLRTNKVK